MEYLSTTNLARQLKIPVNELFGKLKQLGWIERQADTWILTGLGQTKGGQLKSSSKFGEYIVWPSSVIADKGAPADKIKFLNATVVSKHFNISSQRLNLILSELGWIEKDIIGWRLTKPGKNIGGKQLEHETSGNSYVVWPEDILSNKSLNEVFNENQEYKNESNGLISTISNAETLKQEIGDFRQKFPANHRTLDGHLVRSRAEMIIDNTLYQYKVVHAYERKLPIEEDVFSDFYIPAGPVYIEFWGMENDPKYAERKKKKISIYQRHDLPLIELNDDEILNLDDHLPRKLAKFGIKVF